MSLAQEVFESKLQARVPRRSTQRESRRRWYPCGCLWRFLFKMWFACLSEPNKLTWSYTRTKSSFDNLKWNSRAMWIEAKCRKGRCHQEHLKTLLNLVSAKISLSLQMSQHHWESSQLAYPNSPGQNSMMKLSLQFNNSAVIQHPVLKI